VRIVTTSIDHPGIVDRGPAAGGHPRAGGGRGSPGGCHPRLVGSVLLLVVLAPVIAGGAVNVTLVDSSLQSREVRLQAMGQDQVRFAGEDRRLVTEPIGQYVELRFDPGPAESAPTQWVEMTDDQRLVGEPTGDGEMTESLTWKTDTLGTFDLSLDRIRAVRLGKPVPDADMADVIVSANGDRLEGFVLGMSGEGIEFQPNGSDQTLTLQWAQLGSMRLANPDADRDADRYQITTVTGDRLRVGDLAFTGSVFRFEPVLRASGEAVQLDPRAVRRIAVPSDAGQLRSLVAMPTSRVAGGEAFGVTWPIHTRGDAMHLHAPVTVRIDLAKGSNRAAGVVRLDVQPRHRQAARQWSDMTVVLRQGEAAIWRARITAETSEAAFNVAVEEGPMFIEVEVGRFGPVLDRVRIEDAVVLVGGQ